MSGPITPYVDFNNATDTGEANTDAIAPITNGEAVDQTVLRRPAENLRLRTEVLRTLGTDSLYLHGADRNLILAGPGAVTWPGSTTDAASGIPAIDDVLWLLPMLTPGAAQAAPVPPVASAYGTLHLKRDSDSMDSILVTSLRRSYAAGDQINVTVAAGGTFSCTLEVEDGYRRTINIVAEPTTTLGMVIAALAALTPPAPDNTPLITAALEGGALSGDFILAAQARQFVAGNYDGEGHAITPANLASFFSTYTTDAYLAEGDTLCVQFTMLVDTVSTGGRRQAIPENSNTAVTPAMFFNSRVHPDKLVNALPICKVVNGVLVFGTGVEVAAGVTMSLGTPAAATVAYAGGPAWADGTTNPATTVEAQLDKIITDLATGAGTAKVQGAAINSTEVVAGTLAAQLAALATNWLKLNRANTVSALQTFEETGGDPWDSASMFFSGSSDTGTGTPFLIMSGLVDDAAGIRWRLYTIPKGGVVITVNAEVIDGSNAGVDYYERDAAAWSAGTSFFPPGALRLYIGAPGKVTLSYFNTDATVTWDSTQWVDYMTLGSNPWFANAVSAPDFRYTTGQKVHIPAVSARDTGGGGHVLSATGTSWILAADNARITFPITLPVGSRITEWGFEGAHVGGAMVAHARLFSTADGAAEVPLGTEQTSTSGVPAVLALGQSGLSIDVVVGTVYYIGVWSTGAGSGDLVYSAFHVNTRP